MPQDEPASRRATDIWGRPRGPAPERAIPTPVEEAAHDTGDASTPRPADVDPAPPVVEDESGDAGAVPPPAPAGQADLLRDVRGQLGDLRRELQDTMQRTLAEQQRRLDARLDTSERRAAVAAAEVERAAGLLEVRSRELGTVRAELEALTQELRRQAEAFQDASSRQLPDLVERQRSSALALEGLLASLREATGTLDETLDQGLDALSRWRDDLPTTVRRVGAELGRDVDRARERLVADASTSSGALHRAAGHAEGLVQALARVEGLVGGRLDDWEQAGRRERRRAIDDVVTLLVDQLPARHRRRVAEQLLERTRQDDPRTDEGVSPPQNVATRRELVTPPPGPAPSPPPRDQPAPVHAAAATQNPPEPGPEADPALGDVLDQVPGVGPTRRRELIDRFETLAGIAEAEVSDIASVPGIPATLARRVRSHLDGLEGTGDESGGEGSGGEPARED